MDRWATFMHQLEANAKRLQDEFNLEHGTQATDMFLMRDESSQADFKRQS